MCRWVFTPPSPTFHLMQAALQALASPPPTTPLPPLESAEAEEEELLDVTNDATEATKADEMCEKIDHSVNLLSLTATAHLLASDYFYTMHLRLAISSFASSRCRSPSCRPLRVQLPSSDAGRAYYTT